MNAIPYTVERRPDTGVNNVQLGIWLFIASEVMLFGGLFSAYYRRRAGAPAPWLPLKDQLAGAIGSTLSLLVAAGAIAASRAMLPRYRRSLALAALFAVSFCVHKAAEYQELLAAGHGPASSTQMATYFLLTGVHVAHVIGGVIAIGWVALRTGAAPDPLPAANRLRALALYWGFVDVIWLIIFVLLYVV